MRKLLALAIAALLAAPAAVSTAGPRVPDSGAELFRMAFTSFLRHPRDGGAPSVYFGAALGFNVGDDHGFAGRGPCHREERRGRKYWSCSASARGVRVLPTGFYMDPLLQAGHLEFEHKGYNHTVDWTGRGDPNLMYGGGSRSGAVSLSNRASATGRLFGYRFSSKRDRAFGFLAEAAFAWVATDSAEIWMDRDGRLHAHVLVPAGAK